MTDQEEEGVWFTQAQLHQYGKNAANDAIQQTLENVIKLCDRILAREDFKESIVAQTIRNWAEGAALQFTLELL